MTRKILVADDSATIQRVISLAFSDEDVQIEAVASGDLAVEKARCFKPDIVFADILMPGLNGYEVCRAIRSDRDLADARVVLMVGTFEPFDSEEAARVRSDACLTKPFDPGELLGIYRSLLRTAESPAPQPAENEGAGESANAPPRADNVVAVVPKKLVSRRARASFLGSERILELFPREGLMRRAAATGGPGRQTSADGGQDRTSAFSGLPGSPSADKSSQPAAATVPPDMLRSIIEDAVRRLAPEIIREVAWEVVPEISEGIVRSAAERAIGAPRPSGHTVD